ncbi:hypothetical protein [Streptomyces sp. NBC_00459]|uniref:hypothetical protein n=1 Tax=Streptomyces sp. NBC_00459 TaxID=2975749 RepID=UPI002E17C595
MTLARDLARPCPTVRVDDDAQEAARLLVRERLPALLVLDQVECPYAIVPAARLLGALVPEPDGLDPLLTLIAGRLDDGAQETLSGWSVRTGCLDTASRPLWWVRRSRRRRSLLSWHARTVPSSR